MGRAKGKTDQLVTEEGRKSLSSPVKDRMLKKPVRKKKLPERR
tara:strand:- start:394 stop:522 length:129 start_codon:yes stop_codon:yes gene_type:complete